MIVHQIKETLPDGKHIATVCGLQLKRKEAFIDGTISAWASDITCVTCRRQKVETKLDGQGALL